MKERLPSIAQWKMPVAMYPQGPWLLDPQRYKDYVHLVEGQGIAPDLLAIDLENIGQRLHSWRLEGRLECLNQLDFMDMSHQPLQGEIELRHSEAWGLELLAAETMGYRSSYQDKQVVFVLPIDSSEKQVFVSVLLDGHGPTQGGERVAHLLASHQGAQWLSIALKEWSSRLEKTWDQMSLNEQENGFHYAMLELQNHIRQLIVESMHSSQLASQANTLASTLQHTLKALSYQEMALGKPLENHLESLQNLNRDLAALETLEGVGAAAIYTFWIVNEASDSIDTWVVSVGDSWAGYIQRNHEVSYSLVDEAVPSKPHFLEGIQARGGWVEQDDYGIHRLNGEYSLCRGLGDLYLIRQWAEVKACVQIRGMSPRPTVTHVRFCENPKEPFELAFANMGLWVQHCDGLKEGGTLTSDQLTSFLKENMNKNEDMDWVVARLIERAVKGGSQDNCTIQVIDLRPLSKYAHRKRFYKQSHAPKMSKGIFQGFV
jgi:serine/threonine protein phosphatase PrpC